MTTHGEPIDSFRGTVLGILFGVAAMLLQVLGPITGVGEAQEWRFIRGDVSGDGNLALGDAVIVLNALFAGGPAPPCLDAADFDDDGLLELGDGLGTLDYIFFSGPPPAPPFPGCGEDPTPEDEFSCSGPLAYCPAAAADTPSNLEVVAITPTRIDVSWQDNAEKGTGFDLERRVGEPTGPYRLLATLGRDQTTYSDLDLEPDTSYCYRVRALGPFGTSPPSNVDCASTPRTPPLPAPEPPLGLMAQTLGTDQVLLTWTDASVDETGFVIERSTAGPFFVPVATADPDQEIFIDETVSPEASYCYRVRSMNSDSQSAPSNTSCATTHASSITQRILFDTGVFEVSETGPYYPPGHDGNLKFQTRVPIIDFDWTDPVDFTHGKVYQRMDLLERPSLQEFCAGQILQEPHVFQGDHWWPGTDWSRPVDPEIYENIHEVQEMRDVTNLLGRLDDPPPLAMAFVVQCADGGPSGGPNAPWWDPDIYPMQARFTWVVVKEGASFSGWETIVGAERPLVDPLGAPYQPAYAGSVTVVLSTATEGGVIRYTTHGSEPTASSPLYEEPLVLTVTTTIRAKTFKAGLEPSDTTTMTYIID